VEKEATMIDSYIAVETVWLWRQQ